MQVSGCDIMDVVKYPQFQLYLFTLQIIILKNQLLSKNNDDWPFKATVINRAYYSSYLYCELWLDYVKNFIVKQPWDFKDDEQVIGVHKQVRCII